MKCLWFLLGVIVSSGVSYGETKADILSQLQHLLPAPQKDPFSVGAVQKGWDQGDLDSRIKEIGWLPNRVMKLIVRDFMSTTIKLPEWETIVHFESGEDGNFVLKKVCPNILTLRAIYAGCDTNLTVVGKTGNVYTFYVRSVSFQDKQLPDLVYYVHTEIGKDKKDIRKSTLEEREYVEVKDEIPFNPSNLKFDYCMSGVQEIAPQTVYDDGLFTWLDYGKRWNSEDLPTVYLLKDDVESPVNTRIEGTKIVIEAVGDFVLKSGEKRVCIIAERVDFE